MVVYNRVSKEKMKALFKRSSSKNLLEAAASTRRESMEAEDPQEEQLGAVLRQFSFEGRGSKLCFSFLHEVMYLIFAQML